MSDGVVGKALSQYDSVSAGGLRVLPEMEEGSWDELGLASRACEGVCTGGILITGGRASARLGCIFDGGSALKKAVLWWSFKYH